MNRPQHYKNEYRRRLLKQIESLAGNVFARKDLTTDKSNREQLRLNRALKIFIAEGHIIKISHGLYAKAMQIKFSNGTITNILQNSFEDVAIEALNKLGVKWELSSSIQAYNRGETTQVPVVFSVKLKSRFRGSISAENRTVLFEERKNVRQTRSVRN